MSTSALLMMTMSTCGKDDFFVWWHKASELPHHRQQSNVQCMGMEILPNVIGTQNSDAAAEIAVR
jgi:hypothetical protein